MQYHIEGMDCASCIGKIETALARMPGVSDVQLNFATQSLTLSLLADGATQADDVEKT
ncbi:cation transporter, partial [Pseudomonas sp. Q1]